MTFGTPSWNSRIAVYLLTTPDINITPNLVSARINSGDNFGPYKGGPSVATATIVFYYAPGVTVPANLTVNAGIYVRNIDPSTAVNLFYGKIRDLTVESTLDQASGEFGQTVRVFATNVVADLNAIQVPGISTSAATKNQTWEQRLTNTLQPYFPIASAVFPSTGSEAHIYRLVDNNVTGTLVDHVNLACDSVGATWGPSMADNTSYFYAKGVYPKTGILFTDEPNYWNGSNRPANAVGPGVGYTQNVFYSDIEVSRDTRELVNRINVTNVMPKNMVLSVASPGTLLWKSAQTNRPENMEVLTAEYQAQDGTSITTYGVRAQDITTNLYPFRNSDTQTFYAKYNAALDPNVDYRGYINIQCSNANVRYSTATPYNGTQCLDAYATAGGSSYTFVFGDTAGYPINWTINQNAAQFQIAFRTPQASCRFQKGIQYLDSNGNVLLTQTTAVGVPTINVWQFYAGSYMDYTTIPAGAVSWRPIVILTHHAGSFSPGTLIGKFDAITFEPFLQPAALFTGDDADTSSTVQQWLGTPGDSVSYRINNILDNVGSDILAYWKDNTLRPRFIRWNLRLNYFATLMQPLARIDIRFNGANYVSFINSYTIDITQDDCIISAELGYRPSSWN
jgi:hypothetical protein